MPLPKKNDLLDRIKHVPSTSLGALLLAAGLSGMADPRSDRQALFSLLVIALAVALIFFTGPIKIDSDED